MSSVYLTVYTINIYPLTTLRNALLNIIGGKGALSNINYIIIFIIRLLFGLHLRAHFDNHDDDDDDDDDDE